MEVYLILSELNTTNTAPKKSKKCRKFKAPGKRKTIGAYIWVFALVFFVCSLYAVLQMANSRYVMPALITDIVNPQTAEIIKTDKKEKAA